MSNIVRRGGRCLLPISAFGNVQELLLLLDEYWDSHPELQHIPILYASGLAYRGMQVYRTYIHTMNSHIRSRFSKNRNDNPFAFKHVRNLKDFRKWEDNGPCVMMATPQMLQGYQSRELLEKWAPDRKNGLIITGYSIDGTMAKVSGWIMSAAMKDMLLSLNGSVSTCQLLQYDMILLSQSIDPLIVAQSLTESPETTQRLSRRQRPEDISKHDGG